TSWVSPSAPVIDIGCSSSVEMEPTTSSASSVVIAGAIFSMGCSTAKSSSAGAFSLTAETRGSGSRPCPSRPGSAVQVWESSSKETEASTGVSCPSGTRLSAKAVVAASSTVTTGSTACSPDQVEAITPANESSRSTAACAVAVASTVTPRSARLFSSSSSPAVTVTVTDSPRSAASAAISSGVWPATSWASTVVPGGARPSNCFAWASAPPVRTTAKSAMIAISWSATRRRPRRPVGRDGPPGAAVSVTFVMETDPFSAAVVTAPAAVCGRAQGSLPGAALSFRVAEEAYRPIWRIAGPSSQLCIIRGPRRRRARAPSERLPPARCGPRPGATVCTGDPRRRVEQTPEHPEAPRESASRPEGHDRVVTRLPIWHSVQEVPADLGPTAVSIGNYDGVHRGHRFVLDQLRHHAETRSLAPVALTFWPHPRHVMGDPALTPLLTGHEDRDRLLLLAGMTGV